VRARAAEGLSKLGDPRCIGPLISASRHANDDVRQSAAKALEPFSDVFREQKLEKKPEAKEIVYKLAPALAREEAGTRKFAAQALGIMQDRRAVKPLIKALQDPTRSYARPRLCPWEGSEIGKRSMP